MKFIYLNCLLFLFQLGFAQEQMKPTFTRIYEEVNNHSEAYERLKFSTTNLGHRMTGSTNGAKAEEYVYELLKSYGLDVSYQPFEAVAWSRESLSLRLAGEEVASVALAHSPIKADVTADLVDMGNGLEVDYLAKPGAVKGKIALVFLHILPNSGPNVKNLHRSQKTALAYRHGAKGIIFINSVRNQVLLTGTASITGKLIKIPAVCIGYEDGMKWKEALKVDKLSASIAMRNKSAKSQARNVIVHIPGTDKANEKIVIGGHLDSWDLATGAVDNGLGSFAVIDMARTFKALQLQSKRSIDFVLFMGEEQGLLGSKAYVKDALKTKSIDQIKYMLNFDMVNAPVGFAMSRPEMSDVLKQYGAIYAQVDPAFKNENAVEVGLNSDHQPFMLQGIPSGTGRGGQLPNNAGQFYHSNKDVFSLIDQAGMEQTVRIGCAYLYILANLDVIPADRYLDDEIVKMLVEKELKTPLVISGDWRWKK